MAKTSSDSVLTIDELAVYLKLAKSTVYKLAQEGTIPGQKVGRHWRFHRESIEEWLKQSRGAKPTGKKKPKS
jgi:excisionase family DNA binding protein